MSAGTSLSGKRRSPPHCSSQPPLILWLLVRGCKWLCSPLRLLILPSGMGKQHLVSAGQRWEFWSLLGSANTVAWDWGILFPSGRDVIPSCPLGLLWYYWGLGGPVTACQAREFGPIILVGVGVGTQLFL